MRDARRWRSGKGRADGEHPGLLGQLVLGCGLVVAAMICGVILSAAAAPPADSAGAASPARIAEPKEIKYLCARKSDGVLRYVARPAKCDERSEKALLISESRPIYACADRSSGQPVHRVSNLRECSSRETRLTLPPENEAVRFCAAERTGWLRRVSSMGVCRGRAGIPVFVSPTNEAPVAQDQDATTNEDAAKNITLAATDADGDAVTYEVVDSPAHGELTGAAPDLTYTPDPDFFGDDSFTFRANDGAVDGEEATVSIDVGAVNDEPGFTKGPNQTVDEGAGVQTVPEWATSISKGADNESGQTLTFEVTDNTNPALFAASGQPAVSANGTLNYTPKPNTNGEATIKVLLEDDGGIANGGDDTGNEETFVISVGPVNSAPVADDGTQSMDEDGAPITIDFGALVSDVETSNANLDYDVTAPDPSEGTIAPTGDPTKYTFDSAEDFNGTVEISYTVTDRGDPDACSSAPCQAPKSDSGTVTVTVNRVNFTSAITLSGGPSASEVDENEAQNATYAYSFNVSDDDPEDDFTVKNGFPDCGTGGEFVAGTLSTTASGGSFECRFVDGPNTPVVRIQVADDSGTANSDSNVATRDGLTVRNVKPTVDLSGPSPVAESTSIEREYTFTVTDPGNDTFEVEATYPRCGANGEPASTDPLTTNAGGGSFRCVFPDGDTTSNVEIKVKDSDGATDTDNKVVTVTVQNAAPEITSVTADPVIINEGSSSTITVAATDAAGSNDALSYSFDCNGDGDFTDAGDEDSQAADNAACSFDDDGTKQVNARVTDGDGGEDTGSTTVTVENVAPVVTAPSGQTADEGVSETFDLGSFTDPGADRPWNVTVNWGDSPTNTTFTEASPGDVADQAHTYADDGQYTVTVTVAEEGANAPSDSKTFTVEVGNVAPAADDQAVQSNEGEAKTITLTADDVDADEPLTFEITSLPDDGTLYEGEGTNGTEITAGNLPFPLSGDKVTYEPNDPAFTGNDGFDFTACESADPSACDADGARVSIEVRQVNDPPVATDDTATTPEDDDIVIQTSDLLANDSPGANESTQDLRVISVGNAANGAATLSDNNTPNDPSDDTITFDPAADYNGAGASFEYTVEDDGLTGGNPDPQTDVGKVNVTVTPVNDEPVGANDSKTATEDIRLRFRASDLTVNDSRGGGPDESGQNLTVTAVGNAANGAASLDDKGTPNDPSDDDVVFDPASNYNGNGASFTYTVCDDGRTGAPLADDPKCDPSTTVNVTVEAVNDAPEIATSQAALAYDENDAATAIDNGLTLTDVDSTYITGATIRITSGYASGEDVLSFTDQNGITGSISGDTLTLSGMASVADYQTALRSVEYNNTSDDPSTVARTVSFQAKDGPDPSNLSNTATRDITVAAVNDAPVNTVPSVRLFTGEGDDLDITGISTADVDAGTNSVRLTLSVTGGANNGALTLQTDVQDGLVAGDITGNGSDSVTATAPLSKINATLSASNGLLYNNSAGGDYTLTVETNDQGNTGSGGPLDDEDTVEITVDAAPEVTTTTPGDDAQNVPVGGNIVIDFSEPVDATNPDSFELECGDPPSARTFTISSNGTASLTLDPTNDLPGATLCQVRVIASGISDADTSDPPDNMAAAHTFSFETAARAVDDTYPQTVTGNVGINSANIPYSVTTNDEIKSATNVTFFGWNGNSGQTENGGTVSMTLSGADRGKFTYNPPAGFEGNDRFTYTLTGGSSATVTVPVSGMIWFINNSGACTSNCDGRLSNPFTSLSAFDSVNGDGGNNPASGDNIFLFESSTSYTGGVALLANQRLIGQDANQSLAQITGLTPRPSGSAAFPTMSTNTSTRSIITNASGNGITLGASNTIRGLTVGDTSGSGIKGTNVNPASTGLNAATMGSDVAVSGTNGGAAVDISGGSGTISYGGTISGSAGGAVSVANRTGGTTTFGGNVSGGDVNLQNNTGATINFTSGNLDIDTTSATGFSAAGGGAISVTGDNNTINSTGAAALNLSSVTSAVNGISFASVSSGGGTDNVNISGVSGGAISMNGGALSGSTQRAFNASGGNTNITYTGTISNNNQGIRVINKTGGTVTFSGATKTLNTDANPAVTLDNNDAGTVKFTNGGLAIATTSGAGFSAINGATAIEVTGSNNTISSGTGTALNVANSNIGAGGLTFRSISANGGQNGIVLSTTGNQGGLTVSGEGATAGSGGTIQQTTGDGARLTSAANVTLKNMNFTNTAQNDPASGGTPPDSTCNNTTNSGCNAAVNMNGATNVTLDNITINGSGENGINGENVTGFSLAGSDILNAGNSYYEHGIRFKNLLGSASISGTAIDNPAQTTTNYQLRNMQVDNDTGTTTLTISDSFFKNSSPASNDPGDGLLFIGTGTSDAKLTISNTDFVNHRSMGAQIVSQGSASHVKLTVNNGSAFQENYVGLNLNAAASGRMTFLVQNNTFSNTALPTTGTTNETSPPGTKLNVFNTGSGTMHGRITGNQVTSTLSEFNDAGVGIRVNNNETGNVRVEVNNNTVSVPVGPAIDVQSRSANDPARVGRLDALVYANNASVTGNTNGFQGIFARANNAHTICARIENNTASSGTPPTGMDDGIQVTKASTATFAVEGYTPDATGSSASVETYLDAENPATTDVIDVTGSGFTGGACNTPELSPLSP